MRLHPQDLHALIAAGYHQHGWTSFQAIGQAYNFLAELERTATKETPDPAQQEPERATLREATPTVQEAQPTYQAPAPKPERGEPMGGIKIEPAPARSEGEAYMHFESMLEVARIEEWKCYTGDLIYDAANKRMPVIMATVGKNIASLEAEVARLKEENERLHDHAMEAGMALECGGYRPEYVTGLEEEVARLKAQLADAARHRKALETWNRMLADPNYDTGELIEEFADIALAALAPKESESSTNQENK